jgi:hypothetical protein
VIAKNKVYSIVIPVLLITVSASAYICTSLLSREPGTNDGLSARTRCGRQMRQYYGPAVHPRDGASHSGVAPQ